MGVLHTGGTDRDVAFGGRSADLKVVVIGGDNRPLVYGEESEESGVVDGRQGVETLSCGLSAGGVGGIDEGEGILRSGGDGLERIAFCEGEASEIGESADVEKALGGRRWRRFQTAEMLGSFSTRWISAARSWSVTAKETEAPPAKGSRQSLGRTGKLRRMAIIEGTSHVFPPGSWKESIGWT